MWVSFGMRRAPFNVTRGTLTLCVDRTAPLPDARKPSAGLAPEVAAVSVATTKKLLMLYAP